MSFTPENIPRWQFAVLTASVAVMKNWIAPEKNIFCTGEKAENAYIWTGGIDARYT